MVTIFGSKEKPFVVCKSTVYRIQRRGILAVIFVMRLEHFYYILLIYVHLITNSSMHFSKDRLSEQLKSLV